MHQNLTDPYFCMLGFHLFTYDFTYTYDLPKAIEYQNSSSLQMMQLYFIAQSIVMNYAILYIWI